MNRMHSGRRLRGEPPIVEADVSCPREVWIALQMAETLLFRAAAATHPTGMRGLFDGIEVEGAARDLLIRAGSGFSAGRLHPEDYLARYPFSNVGAIRAILDEVMQLGLASRGTSEEYALTERGVTVVRTWMERVAAMMSDLDLGDVSASDVDSLLRFDVQVVEALAKSDRPDGTPILRCRLQGIRPPLDAPPALWHHWQRVWTILAASEDEEEAVRRDRGIDPLAWFIRRQLWFIDRRPWRARARALDGLVARALGYAPVERAKEACAAALDRLTEALQVEEREGMLRLTGAGLAACDQDESEVDARLLARWPQQAPEGTERLREVLDRLNGRLLEIIQAERGGPR